MMTRVLLVDDHRLVREALRDALTKVEDIEVVAEAGDARSALEQTRSLNPDVIVLDIGLPDINGMEVAARLRDAGSPARIVALSAYSEPRVIAEMLRAGASGYVTKSAAGTELVRAIRAVAAGLNYLSPDVASVLVSEVRDGGKPGQAPRLTGREREVLRLVAEGKRTNDIAELLHISAGTAEVHRRNIMRKLGIRTVAELARHAVREGIVPP
jgi:two-component system NarL family response regulator